MKSKDWLRLLLEGLLIVFSVLLALYLNQRAAQKDLREQKNSALASLEREVNRNARVIEDWQQLHSKILERIKALRQPESDSLRSLLIRDGQVQLSVITMDQSVAQANLNHTAWQTAQSTNILSELEYELVEELTQTYALQEMVMQETLARIINLFFERQTHNADHIEASLLQFELLFTEMVGQEYILAQSYKDLKASLGQRKMVE